MHRYLVADVSAANRLVALRDAAGRYHVAHCSSGLPDVQAVLDGPLASMGSAQLTAERGEAVRVIFSHLYRGPREALELLHAVGTPAEAEGAQVEAQRWGT